MKTLTYISIIILSLLVNISKGGNGRKSKPDSIYCLEVTGKITNLKKVPGNCKVELLVDDDVVDSIILVDGKRKFTFDLEKNLHYTIRLSKPGYATRTVCIRTNIPSTKDKDGMYRFIFETKLFEDKSEDVLTEIKHTPIARIFFDDKKDCFYYKKMKNNIIKKDLCKS